jgi:hypothetical protein
MHWGMGSTMLLVPSEGRYGSVHIVISGKKTKQAAKLRLFASCSLLVLRIHFLGLQVRLCTAFSGISVGDCIRPCVRKNGKKRE